MPTENKIATRALNPVAETLMLPLCYRALETRRPDTPLRDPKAGELVAQLDLDFARIERQLRKSGQALHFCNFTLKSS